MATITSITEKGGTITTGSGTPSSLNIKGKDKDRYVDRETGYLYLYSREYATANPSLRSPWVSIFEDRVRVLTKDQTLAFYDNTVDLAGFDLKVPLGKNMLPLYHLFNSSSTNSTVTFTGSEKLLYRGELYSSFELAQNEHIDLVFTNPYWFASGSINSLYDHTIEVLKEAKCFTMAMVTKYG